jgi:hypothetical protein
MHKCELIWAHTVCLACEFLLCTKGRQSVRLTMPLSRVATVLRRRTALSYTKYMDYCCQSLAELREYQTDQLIPYIVRSQQISRRIVDTFSYDDLNFGEIRGEFLVTFTSDAFMRDLDCLRKDVPPNLMKNSKRIFLLMELPPFHGLLTGR